MVGGMIFLGKKKGNKRDFLEDQNKTIYVEGI